MSTTVGSPRATSPRRESCGLIILVNVDSIVDIDEDGTCTLKYHTFINRITYAAERGYEIVMYKLATSGTKLGDVETFINYSLRSRGYKYELPKYDSIARRDFIEVLNWRMEGGKKGILVDEGTSDAYRCTSLLRSSEMRYLTDETGIECFTSNSYFTSEV